VSTGDNPVSVYGIVELANRTVPVPVPTPVAIKYVPTVLDDAPISVKFVLPIVAIKYPFPAIVVFAAAGGGVQYRSSPIFRKRVQ
jgi:hypothetical protein